jgi:hypothetical protein
VSKLVFMPAGGDSVALLTKSHFDTTICFNLEPQLLVAGGNTPMRIASSP